MRKVKKVYAYTAKLYTVCAGLRLYNELAANNSRGNCFEETIISTGKCATYALGYRVRGE